jgi:uncharacterized protein YgbK (DUF1537 family)
MKIHRQLLSSVAAAALAAGAHAAITPEQAKALLQKYPSFRVDVYPTQRSVAFPK